MKHNTSSPLVIAVFVTALAMLAGATFINTRITLRHIDVDRLYVASRARLTSIQELKSIVLTAVIAERNFILSGNDQDLQPYEQAKADARVQVEKIDPLIDDASPQQSDLDELRSLFQEKFAALDEMIAMRRAHGIGREVTSILVDRSIPLLTKIDAAEGIMQNAEAATLQQLENRSSDSVYLSLAVSSGGSALALLLLVLAFVMLEREIVRRRVTEAGLVEAKQVADAANRAKSEFLANMSHEIRTPMNAILGFAELLGESASAGIKDKSNIDGIKTAGKSLMIIINDILDLSKIEAGRLDIRLEPVSLPSLLRDVERIFSVAAARKKLDFRLTIARGIPDVLRLDEVRLRQVLFNLLGNAMKFTDKGSVGVAVTMTGQVLPANLIDLEIDVIDTGIGIAAADQEAIFEPFRQAFQGERRFGGTGLGLAISRRLVAAMGGSLSVRSEIGRGSLFRVRLPGVQAAVGIEPGAGGGGPAQIPPESAIPVPSVAPLILLFIEQTRKAGPLRDAIGSAMREEILPEHKRLKITLEVKAVRAWCLRLQELSGSWGCPALADFASTLESYADSYQINEIVGCLREFNAVLEEFTP